MIVGNLYLHADGGYYCLLSDDAPMKHPDTGDWLEGVIYTGVDHQLRSTTKARFAERFVPVAVYGGDDEAVEAMIRRCNPELDFDMADVWAAWNEAESAQTASLIEIAVASVLAGHGWTEAGIKVVPEWDGDRLVSMSVNLSPSDFRRILAGFEIERKPVAAGYQFTVTKPA